MFGKVIDYASLSGQYANDAFPNITANAFNGDSTFKATLRALLSKRAEGASVRTQYGTANYSGSAMRNAGLHSVLGAAVGDFHSDTIHILNLTNGMESERAVLLEMLDDPENGFVKLRPKFVEMTNIREFVAPQMSARFYLNEEDQMTFIVIERMTTRTWHYMQSFTPRYLPWFFKSEPISDDEKNLLISLTNRSSDAYERLIEAFADKIDLRAQAIKSVFGGLEKRIMTRRIRALEQESDSLLENMHHIMEDYSRAVRRFNDTKIKLLGAQTAAESAGDGSETIDYLMCNKAVDPVASDDSQVEIIIRTYLESFDPDQYETMARRESSHLFTGYDVGNRVFQSKSVRKKLLDAIFSDDPLIKIRTCGYYLLYINGGCNSHRGYHFPSRYADYMPNPHLHYFDCLGDYPRYINEHLEAGDMPGAIEQCIASCKSINVGESPTMPRFLGDLFSTNNKVLELPDGTNVSPEEALNWLNSREEGA